MFHKINLYLGLICFGVFFNAIPKIRFGNKASSLEFTSQNSFLILNEKISDLNGTLKVKDNSIGRILGQDIVFNDGILCFENESDLTFTGTYNISNNNEMLLQDGSSLAFATGKTVNCKLKIPTNATVKISGGPIFNQPIVLEDATATLRIALKSNLGQNIYLNGGTLILDDDLSMAAGSRILGGGVIDINNKSFRCPSGDFADGDITYLNAQDVTLSGNTTYTSNQNFTGSNNDFFGRGCSVSLNSANGRITVAALATFNGVNVNFSGLAGTSNSTSFGVFNINATSTVYLQNTTLDLAGNYTQATGTIVFGNNCKIITHGFNFNVTGATQIIIDAASLLYENLDSNDNSPFTFTDQASQLKLLRNSVIREAISRGPYNLSTTTGTLYNDYILSAAAPISITQPATTLAGNGFALHFPTTGTGLITLSNSATVTTSNIVLNNFNKNAITYGTSASMSFGTNTQLRLFDDVAISGADKNWNFTGTNGSITGSGCRVNFTGSNNITVGAGNTVTVRDVHFKGLGISNGIFSINATGTLILEQCTVELATNYTHSAGTIIVRDGCKIVPNGFTFATTGLAFVRIDATALEYENLDKSDLSPFTFTDGNSQRVLLNGGVIRSSINRSNLNLSTTSGTLYNDYILSAAAPITITQPTTTLAGGGFTLHFPTTGTGLISLSNSATLTTSNIVLNNFNKDAITYGTSASMSFGSGTQIRLFDDITITGADKAWNFTGTGQIIGTGNTLTLNGSNRLTVTGSNTLTLKNLKIICKTASALTCLTSTAKIVFDNCSVQLEQPGFTFATGNIDVLGTVKFTGGNPATINDASTFTMSTAGQFKILSGSTLSLGPNIEFIYAANPSGDAGVTYNSKRHFKFTDSTSSLELNSCNLHSTVTGLAIDFGRLWVMDSSKLQVDGSLGTEMEIGSAVDLYIKPAASLVVTGTLKYIPSVLP